MKTRFQQIKGYCPGALILAEQILGCHDDALDIVQDAVITVLGQSPRPDEPRALKAWFLKIVRHRSIDRLRADKRYDRSVSAEEALDAAAETGERMNPQLQLEQSQTRLQIQNALMTLDSTHREILILREINGFSYAELAELLEINQGTVMSRLHRARMALRRQLMATMKGSL